MFSTIGTAQQRLRAVRRLSCLVPQDGLEPPTYSLGGIGGIVYPVYSVYYVHSVQDVGVKMSIMSIESIVSTLFAP